MSLKFVDLFILFTKPLALCVLKKINIKKHLLEKKMRVLKFQEINMSYWIKKLVYEYFVLET
jgi:hypothetical protein